MRKTFLLFAFCFAFSIIVSTASTSMARKLTLTVANKSPEIVNVAVTYLKGNEWITEGWWGYEVNEKADFVLADVDGSHIYIYGQGIKDRVWQGKKDDAKTKSFVIGDDDFSVVVPNKPKGMKTEVVPFIYVEIGNNNTFEYTFNP